MAWNVRPSGRELAVLMEAGMILRDARRFDDARIVFEGVRALAPSAVEPEIALGTVAFHQGDFATAKQHYRSALERNPRSAWACAQMAEAELFDRRKEEARNWVKKTVDLDPAGPYGAMARQIAQLADEVGFSSEGDSGTG